ncbi:MAG: TolC family protein [Sulfuriferula sp.]|nr:TolC family protein [Sulfuriferula sp.]
MNQRFNCKLKFKPKYSALSLAVITGLFTLSTAHAETLNFQQCVNTALKQNFDLVASRAQIEQAQAGLQEAKGYRWPKIVLSMGASYTDNALNVFGTKLSQRNATFNDFGLSQYTGNGSVAPTALNYPGFIPNFNPGIEFKLPLYDGGLISGGIHQAEAYIKAAQNGDIAARQKVIFQVLQAYQGVHTARAYLKVAQQGEATAQSQVKMMQNLVKGGVIVKSDLLSAQVRLQDVKIQVMQAENAVTKALDQLHLLLGMPLKQPLDVGAQVTVKSTLDSTDALRQAAIDNNPSINALRKLVDVEKAKTDIARAGYKPQVGVMLRQDWFGPTPSLNVTATTVGINATWTAFDGGVTNAIVTRALAAQTETEAKLAQAEAGIAFQVEDARRNAVEAEQRLVARQLGREQAEEAASIVTKRYANGVATITEQLGAQAQLDKARADVVAAEYDVAVQRANLKLALGQLEADQL